MKVGLMWFDNDPRRPLEEKIKRAARRYKEKFGRFPNVCYVNPALLEKNEVRCGSLRVVAASDILPHHFWLCFSNPDER